MFQEVVRKKDVRQGGGGSTKNLSSFLLINMHANARLTPLARSQMVRDFLRGGLTFRAAAAARKVSEPSGAR